MRAIFTDLDGTLLDRDTYSWEDARPALEALEAAGVPVILTTSKTRAETEFWRARMGNRHPFIVENGGAVVVPAGYFGAAVPGARQEGSWEVISLGRPYPELVALLREAAAETGVEVAGFHQMSASQIARKCGLPVEQAALAKLRWYDEPFEVLSGSAGRLAAALRRRGATVTRGGRFHHVKGRHDKRTATRALCALFAKSRECLFTIGVGDHWNDRRFLSDMDLPVVMHSPCAAALRAVIPHAALAPAGPKGWAETISRVLAGIVQTREGAGKHRPRRRAARSGWNNEDPLAPPAPSPLAVRPHPDTGRRDGA